MTIFILFLLYLLGVFLAYGIIFYGIQSFSYTIYSVDEDMLREEDKFFAFLCSIYSWFSVIGFLIVHYLKDIPIGFMYKTYSKEKLKEIFNHKIS